MESLHQRGFFLFIEDRQFLLFFSALAQSLVNVRIVTLLSSEFVRESEIDSSEIKMKQPVLPDLALISILNCFSLHDQLTICRLVCKQWKALVDILVNSRKELVLFCRLLRRPSVWGHSQQPIRLYDSIVANESITDGQRLVGFFPNLKSLYIATFEIELRGLDLNKFVQLFPNLEHLEINNLYFGLNEKIDPLVIDLDHANLRTLHLGYKDRIVTLNCPALTSLFVYDTFYLDERFSSIQNSLKFLKVRSFFHAPDQVLPNLEVLCFSVDLQIDILHFEKLREIHYYYREVVRDDRIDSILASLLERKMSLKRDLQVYDSGNRCEPGSKDLLYFRDIDDLFEFSVKELDQILSNLNELEVVKGKFHPDHVAFGEDQKRTGEELVEHMARNIRHICAPDLNLLCTYNTFSDGSQPIPFSLKSSANNYLPGPRVKNLFKCVERLQLGPISQSLLNELPSLLPSLVVFISVHPQRFQARTLNFTFLSRFRALKSLAVEKDWISIELLSKIFANCKFLDYLEIWENQNLSTRFLVYPLEDCQYKVVWNAFKPSKKELILQSKADLLDYFEKNRLIKKHFFDDFFSRNYYLVNAESDPDLNAQINPNYHLTPEDYFFERF